MQTIPPLSHDLIKNLDKMYPPVRNPNLDISERQLWGQIYQRQLVDHLLFLSQDQPNDINERE